MRESAAGIADVVGRMKINLGQGRRYGGALLTEVRLPTGDEANLRGAGSTSARAVGVVGAQFGSFSLHSNASYLLRTGTLQNDAPIDIPFPFARRLGARAQRRRAAQESRDSAVVLLDHRVRDQLLIDVGRTRYLVHPA